VNLKFGSEPYTDCKAIAKTPSGSLPGVKGNGSYGDFRDPLKLWRDHSDKYIMALIDVAQNGEGRQ